MTHAFALHPQDPASILITACSCTSNTALHVPAEPPQGWMLVASAGLVGEATAKAGAKMATRLRPARCMQGFSAVMAAGGTKARHV